MPACCALVSQCSAQADLTLTVFGASRFDNITVVINVTSRGYKRSTTCSPLPPPRCRTPSPLNPAAVVPALRRLDILLISVRELAPGLEPKPKVIERRHLLPGCLRAAHVRHLRVHAPAGVAAERGGKHLMASRVGVRWQLCDRLRASWNRQRKGAQPAKQARAQYRCRAAP